MLLGIRIAMDRVNGLPMKRHPMPVRLEANCHSAALVTAAGMERSIEKRVERPTERPAKKQSETQKSGKPLASARSEITKTGLPAKNGQVEARAQTQAQVQAHVGASERDGVALDVPDAVRRVRAGDEDAARQLLNHLYPL